MKTTIENKVDDTAPALPNTGAAVTGGANSESAGRGQEGGSLGQDCVNGGSDGSGGNGGYMEELPAFKVSGVFSSHMVLQRGQHVKIYGFSNRTGMKVTGRWEKSSNGAASVLTAEAAVNEDGRFELIFEAVEADRTPSRMTIESEAGSAVFDDILVGDVWLIGGQSNAECAVAHCLQADPGVVDSTSEDDNFRLFRQTQAKAYELRDNCPRPYRDVIDPGWKWARPGKEAALAFSAIGFYFAKELTAHTDVPVGLFMMCPGGACLRELMPAELARERGYETGANMPVGGYYNTLISPAVGMCFRGQIFFQGESEGIWKEMAYSYHEDLKAFVSDQRARFGVGFPFYNVQLSSYRDEGSAFFPYLNVVRLRQFDAQKIIPDSHLAVSRDLGSLPDDSDWAHSPHKKELGRRLAAQIYAYEYAEGADNRISDPADYESPVPESYSRSEDGYEIRFGYAGSGLRAATAGTGTDSGTVANRATPAGTLVKGFAVYAAGEEQPVPAEAYIVTNDTVRVICGKDAAAIGYAAFHRAYIEDADLTNGSGLPAPAFRLDVTERS